MITNVIPTASVIATAALVKMLWMSKLPRNSLGRSTPKVATIAISTRKIQIGLVELKSRSRMIVSSAGRAGGVPSPASGVRSPSGPNVGACVGGLTRRPRG